MNVGSLFRETCLQNLRKSILIMKRIAREASGKYVPGVLFCPRLRISYPIRKDNNLFCDIV